MTIQYKNYQFYDFNIGSLNSNVLSYVIVASEAKLFYLQLILTD